MFLEHFVEKSPQGNSRKALIDVDRLPGPLHGATLDAKSLYPVDGQLLLTDPAKHHLRMVWQLFPLPDRKSLELVFRGNPFSYKAQELTDR